MLSTKIGRDTGHDADDDGVEADDHAGHPGSCPVGRIEPRERERQNEGRGDEPGGRHESSGHAPLPIADVGHEVDHHRAWIELDKPKPLIDLGPRHPSELDRNRTNALQRGHPEGSRPDLEEGAEKPE